MCQLIAAAALLLSGGIADAGGIAVLVNQLGSPDFRARESASKQLGAIGAPALPALRAAKTNADPEVSRRAAVLAEAITKRVDNDRTLTPKLVELSAEGVPLSEVLARLEKQTGYKLVVADPTLLRKNVSVTTKGQVPFWTAVGQVCDAAKLSVDTSSDAERQLRAARQLAGSRPTRTGANGIRGGIIRSDTIHLQPRSEPLNPSCVSGAVRVEAVPFPTAGRVVVPFDTIPVLLQITPESRLRWIRVESVRITKAVDDAGQNLTAQTVADAATLPTQVTRVRGGAIAVNARGGVNLVPGQPMTANRVTLNRPTQAIARLKVGENPSKQLRKLTGVIRGEVRSAPEEIATLAGLGDKPTATNSHGVGLKVSGVTKSGDDYTMDVTMNYDPSAVQPANSGGAGLAETVLIQNGGRVILRRQAAVVIVNGRRLNPARDRAAMLYGLSVADADGKAFNLRLTRHSIVVNTTGGHIAHKMTFLAQPSEAGQGKPVRLSFHGTRTKHVEVPFKLTDVPAAAGTGPK